MTTSALPAGFKASIVDIKRKSLWTSKLLVWQQKQELTIDFLFSTVITSVLKNSLYFLYFLNQRFFAQSSNYNTDVFVTVQLSLISISLSKTKSTVSSLAISNLFLEYIDEFLRIVTNLFQGKNINLENDIQKEQGLGIFLRNQEQGKVISYLFPAPQSSISLVLSL